MNPYAMFFVTAYLVCKKLFELPALEHLFKRHKQFKILTKIILVILALFLILLSIILLLPLIVFKLVVYVYLRSKYGEGFGGFLNGQSVNFTMQKEQVAIHNIILVEHDDCLEDFCEEVKAAMEKTHKYYYQLSSVVENCLGYYYILKDQVDFGDVFSKVTLNGNKEIITFDDVMDYLDTHRIIEDKRLWEVVLFTQPLWKDNKKSYAIFIRFNHCVVDGASALAAGKKYLVNPNQAFDKSKVNLDKYTKSFDLDNCYMHKNPFQYHNDQLKEGYRQHSTAYIDDQHNIQNKIRAISKKYNATYNDVLAAGLVRGISSLLETKNVKSNGKLQLVFTGSTDMKQIQHLLYGGPEPTTLSNEFLVIPVVVPVCKKGYSLSALLLEISKECEAVRKSMNPLIIYTIMKYVLPLFPSALHRKTSASFDKKLSLVISNVGNHPTKAVCGRKLRSINTTLNFTSNKTIFACFCSYENFIATISGRYSFLENRQDVQDIMEEMLNYIEELYREITEGKSEGSDPPES